MKQKNVRKAYIVDQDYLYRKVRRAFLQKYPYALTFEQGTDYSALWDRPLFGGDSFAFLLESPKDLGEAQWTSFLKTWDEDTPILVLWHKKPKAYFLTSFEVIPLESPKPWELGAWISKEVKQVYKIDVDADHVSILMQNVGTDISVLMNDMGTLALYLGQQDRVKAHPRDYGVVFASHQQTIPFPFIQAVVCRKLQLSLAWLSKLYSDKDATMLLVTLLTKALHELCYVLDERPQDVESFLKDSLNIRAREQVKVLLQALSLWSWESLLEALEGLSWVEAQFKQGKQGQALISVWLGRFLS